MPKYLFGNFKSLVHSNPKYRSLVSSMAHPFMLTKIQNDLGANHVAKPSHPLSLVFHMAGVCETRELATQVTLYCGRWGQSIRRSGLAFAVPTLTPP